MILQDKIILIILYTILSICILIQIFKSINKNQKITIRCFFEFYYLLIYGITPIMVLLNNNSFTRGDFYFTDSIRYYYYLYIASVLFYITYKIATLFIAKNIKTNKKRIIDTSSKQFYIATIIISIIGIVSLLLWTKAYGYPWDIIKYANVIRSGRSTIANNFTFIKPLCSLVIIAFYCHLIMMKTTKHKIINTTFLITNLLASVIYLLANDSRMFILVFILCIVLYYKNKNLNTNLKTILVYTFLAIITLISLSKLDTVTYYIRNGKAPEKSYSESGAIGISEFSYTYRNGINTIYLESKGLIKSHEIKDIKNLFLFWLPERIYKDKEDLTDYNTAFYNGISGAIPTDIITASIYKFHYLGIIIMPIIISLILNQIEKIFKKLNSNYMDLIYNMVGCNTCLRLIGYYDLYSNIRSSIYIIVSTLIIYGVCKRTTDNAKN